MLAEELLYIGHPVAHVVTHYENLRLKRIRAALDSARRARERREGFRPLLRGTPALA